jgi:quinoprotein glucose dehydrogenase
VNLEKRLDRESALQIVVGGKGMMPAFTGIKAEEMKLLLDFLYSAKKDGLSEATTASKRKEPGFQEDSSAWKISGYTKFLDSNGYPAISPPWGTLHAIDMNTGEYRWSKVYGETPALKDTAMQQTGSESYGGPVVTQSGLLFIAGTKDAKFRAYNKRTGDLVWETKLPAAAFATPSTYAVKGKQYVVVACGGTKLGAPKGDSYVAFSLK